MEKIAYIQEFESPILFIYPWSKLFVQLILPLIFYVVLMIPGSLWLSGDRYQLVVILGTHVFFTALLIGLVHFRFPIQLLFKPGTLQFTRLLGTSKDVPYEDFHAILETPQLTVFSLKSGARLLFLPKQTHNPKDFERVLNILQDTLQSRKDTHGPA